MDTRWMRPSSLSGLVGFLDQRRRAIGWEIGSIGRQVKPGANLSVRARRDSQEIGELSIASPQLSLGNICCHRERGLVQFLHESEVALSGRGLENRKNLTAHLTRTLPDHKVFESRSHAVSNGRTVPERRRELRDQPTANGQRPTANGQRPTANG